MGSGGRKQLSIDFLTIELCLTQWQWGPGFKIGILGVVLAVLPIYFRQGKTAWDGTDMGNGVVQTLVRGVLLN